MRLFAPSFASTFDTCVFTVGTEMPGIRPIRAFDQPALVPSSKKRGGLGTAIDVPLGHKDAAYLRSHFHAMEARGANDTIQKIYQIVTGARGEPGNWNAEVPVRDEIERLRALLRVAIDDFETTHGVPNPKKYPNHWTVEARAALHAERDMEAGR